MISDKQRMEWETGRVAEPMDFPAIVFAKLAALLISQIGTRDRHRHLQDLADILSPYQDETYRNDVTEAAKERDSISQGRRKGIQTKEGVETHQRLWVSAIMRLMKRRNLLGEDWVRG